MHWRGNIKGRTWFEISSSKVDLPIRRENYNAKCDFSKRFFVTGKLRSGCLNGSQNGKLQCPAICSAFSYYNVIWNAFILSWITNFNSLNSLLLNSVLLTWINLRIDLISKKWFCAWNECVVQLKLTLIYSKTK